MTKSRKSLSKRIRFEVFKRDIFTCQYCGQKPPDVMLEVDHITPIAKGGTDSVENLVAACFGCNRGKSDVPLVKTPESLLEVRERMAEAERQATEYEKLKSRRQRKYRTSVAAVDRVFVEGLGSKIQESLRRSIRLNFAPHLTKDELAYAADVTVRKFKYKPLEKAERYFCGVCWNLIRRAANG